jgi:hypothetical protein
VPPRGAKTGLEEFNSDFLDADFGTPRTHPKDRGLFVHVELLARDAG